MLPATYRVSGHTATCTAITHSCIHAPVTYRMSARTAVHTAKHYNMLPDTNKVRANVHTQIHAHLRTLLYAQLYDKARTVRTTQPTQVT